MYANVWNLRLPECWGWWQPCYYRMSGIMLTVFKPRVDLLLNVKRADILSGYCYVRLDPYTLGEKVKLVF